MLFHSEPTKLSGGVVESAVASSTHFLSDLTTRQAEMMLLPLFLILCIFAPCHTPVLKIRVGAIINEYDLITMALVAGLGWMLDNIMMVDSDFGFRIYFIFKKK